MFTFTHCDRRQNNGNGGERERETQLGSLLFDTKVFSRIVSCSSCHIQYENSIPVGCGRVIVELHSYSLVYEVANIFAILI